MQKLITGLLLLVGAIHLLPVSGVLGAERLAALYGVVLQDPNMLILMRHRAVLFGLLGLFFILAAFRPALQPMAFVAGLISVVSFVFLAWTVGGHNAALQTVVIVDLVAAMALALAAVLYLRTPVRAERD